MKSITVFSPNTGKYEPEILGIIVIIILIIIIIIIIIIIALFILAKNNVY